MKNKTTSYLNVFQKVNLNFIESYRNTIVNIF